jgi:branched-chain amino acid transport system permease protein
MRSKPLTIAFIAVFTILLALVPVVIKSDSVLNLVILILLYVMLATSWNILGGFTGQTNLGHAAFFGLGAMATRLIWFSGVNIFPSLLAGGLLAVAFAFLIGAPAFKLKGVYFAIGTLALAQALNVTAGNLFPMVSSLPAKYMATYALIPRYYFFLGLAIFIVSASVLLVKSKFGLGMMAVREEEDAAESLGISAMKHKLLALVVSAFFAGLAGGAFAYYQVSYYPQFPFSPVWTFDAVTMVYIGGTGTIIGPIIGAVFFVALKELLAINLAEYHILVFSVLFILVVLFLPGGLVEAWTKIKKLIKRRSAAKPAKIPPGAKTDVEK